MSGRYPAPDPPPEWTAALADAANQLVHAYNQRLGLMHAARKAGLTYRQIGDPIGLTDGAVAYHLGPPRRGTLDQPDDGGRR